MFNFYNLRKVRGWILLLVFMLPMAVQADRIRMYESELNEDDARAALEDFLNKLDQDNFTFEEETAGFTFYVRDHFFSAFDYDIYGGYISRDIQTTIIRLEGNSGDVMTFARMLEIEGIIPEGSERVPPGIEAQTLGEKSHIIGQSLNLIAPWMAVWYTSWNSPRMTSGQTWGRFFQYFLLDAFLIYAGGSDFFQGPLDLAQHGGKAAALAAIPRLIGLNQTLNMVRGHNRIARMGYTFYLD